MIFRNIVDGRILISNARLLNITCLSKVVHHSRVSFPIYTETSSRNFIILPLLVENISNYDQLLLEHFNESLKEDKKVIF